jgi:hypothetical protein
MRTFARTASKSMEKKLVENAKRLKQNPYLVLPEYSDKRSEKYFGKIKKRIDKINNFIDDADKLEKFSKKRDLSGAVAGTLLLAHSEKAPYLAVAKFPTGDVTYAKRGNADKEHLIAAQRFDDPILRLLGIKDVASKKHLHVYSWDNAFFSSGEKPNPPNDFVDFITNKTDLVKKNNMFMCTHINPKNLEKNEYIDDNYLRIHWKSTGTIFGICEKCASRDKNTFYDITKYMIEPNITNDFEISVVGKTFKEKSNNTKDLEDYFSGKVNDYDFIRKNMQRRKKELKESSDKVFILDGKSYNTDADGFIKALDPNEFEKIGLDYILKNIDEPVVFDDATPNKVLEHYWKDYGLKTIEELIKDKEMAKKFHSLKEEPSDILELVCKFKERQKILSRLPKYRSLPPLAKFVDNIARTYKTFGEKETLVEIKNRPDDTKAKSLSYAFLLALDKGKDKKWQYSEVEIEYGNFLKEYAKNLLNSNPEKYHENLKNLLVASGFTKNIDSNRV